MSFLGFPPPLNSRALSIAAVHTLNMTTPTCYMCSAPKTSVEHVPPRGLFPKTKDLPPGVNLRKQLITVPSCEIHNTEKSADDEYLMYALVFGIQNNVTASSHIRTKITRAFTSNPAVPRLITQHPRPVRVEDTSTGKIEETMALRINTHRVHQALDHIGRALHFHHFREKWTADIQVIPLFLLALDGESALKFNDTLASMGVAAEALFSDQPAHGNNPEVFSYRVVQLRDHISAAMLLDFYEGSKVVLLFKK